MIPSLGHFMVVLQLYFLREFSLQRAFYILTVLVATYPLFKLHLNQRREPRQPRETAWLRSIFTILDGAFNSKHEHPHFPPEADDLGPGLVRKLCGDLEHLYHLLGIDDPSNQLFPEAHTILCTTRLDCIFCPNDGRPPTLRRHRDPQQILLLDDRFRWVNAELYVAYCAKCGAEYYPDRITYHENQSSSGRVQRLEYDATYLRVSKHGIWMDRRVALAQENAILRFHSGWANFAEWLSDTIGRKPRITTRQSQRLYFEHFARRLIAAHNLEEDFIVPAHSDARTLVECVRETIGKDGGVVPGSMEHGCMRCTHLKRYTADLLAEGAVLNENTTGVIDAPELVQEGAPGITSEGDLPPELRTLPKQQERVPGSARGYTRLAVMDGKTITHRCQICAVNTCNGPLMNYKNGRFCKDHHEMGSVCGIVACGRPVSEGTVTCNNESHREWHRKYLNRFGRLSFPGVQRVIRRQAAGEAAGLQPGPALHSELPELNGVAGDNVLHTFRAKTTYCLQTVQWSCGCPIGWGKCYRSESSPQVLKIIDKIWESNPNSRPSFLAYDDACNLLRHIVTQNPNSPWVHGTKLIVDAWHYIGHQASDVLCRIWCNPAPANGSQPDLISVKVDDNGRTHTTRAFNTETAEQLNAWLNGYEAQL
ncbi:hypothetical protein DFH08DRAFT_808179 [Mycena albidolilacea]|uniref:CxC5 like cysteine cluster associated with KDZ domain-containing protein n=1 Tax=Mycena albidolilacea TaxID=1033008 RepID=A0AAD7A303_9AGAR|nr:hypothetical protein DFH08DRAFT_808179 [Mycena albidolilacea]